MATAGKYLTIQSGGAILHRGAKKWSVEETGETLDDSDAETNGFESTDVGLFGATVTVEGIWDTADGVFPAIRKGYLLTNVNLFANRNQAIPDYSFPQARVTKRPRTVELAGQIQWTLELRNVGVFQIDGVDANL